MPADAMHSDGPGPVTLPSVTIAFLVHNRREELRTSLRKMLVDSNYPSDRVDVIVVDNASSDGSGDMVASEFPQARLIRRQVNCGVSGFNDAFAAARGEYVLALDDDCYLPPNGLTHAVTAARGYGADLVSFGVASAEDPTFRFDREYVTGLLAFWGCAVLISRRALACLGGYDPNIFVWANELEFTIRLFDRGLRHLHLPEVVAVHMKPPLGGASQYFRSWTYEMNSHNFAYIAAKLMWPRDAALMFLALATTITRNVLRVDRAAARGLQPMLRGFLEGLRSRHPVSRVEVSRTYRRDFHSYAPPWRMSRRPRELAVALPVEWVRAMRGLPRPDEDVGWMQYLRERPGLYPQRAATLDFRSSGRANA